MRGRGERVTRARQAVLEVLDGTDDHLTADEIVHLASARAPGVHRATVYRALATLGDLEIVSHTHIGGSAAVYHLTVSGQHLDPAATGHAHVQCSTCGAVIDIPAELLQPLVAKLSADLDFQLAPRHAALLGTCATCRRSPDYVP
nr:transcriptional repressor [Microlunatus panaciterrae]